MDCAISWACGEGGLETGTEQATRAQQLARARRSSWGAPAAARPRPATGHAGEPHCRLCPLGPGPDCSEFPTSQDKAPCQKSSGKVANYLLNVMCLLLLWVTVLHFLPAHVTP